MGSQYRLMEKKAITEISLASVEAQTEIARAGLTSQGAFAFLDKLPTIESLMPALSFEAVAGKAEPPVAEQLISPGALRQRRYRERHRNAEVTSRNGGMVHWTNLPGRPIVVRNYILHNDAYVLAARLPCIRLRLPETWIYLTMLALHLIWGLNGESWTGQ